MQQMRSAIEKEMNRNKIRGGNKGYVFQMMPLYAIGIGVYVIYKLVQVKSKENEKLSQKKNKIDKKKIDTEYQLSELELRLAQTEKMLDSLVKELDPLASCVDAVATEQTSEIMTQLQQIRHLMKERETPTFEDSTSIREGRIHLFENVQEREGIKMQWMKDQAIAESEEELQEDETLTIEVTPPTFHSNTETCHNNSAHVSEINSEAVTCVGDMPEIFGPMRLRKRNKMNEYGK
uniref:Resistance to inhibitors of cholinesterase protein 3 N-terminal domain-containing protein n=1 Tax=Callorhinchus milii TaxID=7868 RepID=A0A4W3I678_CALMI|eukprot:gi/632955557/ref/XP_007893522.1/ PREDICTED: coiled-coil domain-containing protein 107 isoform X2 [Callorhinchus milii]